jgi:uncharacterized membrane protein YdbT with pleckstrin-like domain
MASYIQGALIPGENVVYVGHISRWSLTPLLLLGLLLLPAFGLGLVFFLAAYIRYKSTELAVTNKRVMAKFGFISRRTTELNINKIEGIEVLQGFWGRVFNYGSLLISGTGSLKEPIPYISDPLEFRRAFMGAQDAVLPARQAS